MKKAILIFTLLAIISCKKEEQKAVANIVKTDSLSVAVKTISADTIFFTYDEKWKAKDIALVYLLDKKYNKDSICTATFKIDFKDNRRATIFSKTLKIRSMDYEGSEWYGYLELDTIASPLKRIGYGYPACGYTQNNFLFYIDEKKPGLIHEWTSGNDSGWGYWSEVVSGKPQDFYFRTQSFSPVGDSAQDEFGLNEYSDSIHFKFENNKWKKTYLTPKGKVYRSKKVAFDTFYKQG
jgi:hypothetical protein